jgi:hypothetical protein
MRSTPGRGRPWAGEGDIELSVGSAGNSYDNALRNGPQLSSEPRRTVAQHGSCRIHRAQINNRNLLAPIGNIPPAQAEANYLAANA